VGTVGSDAPGLATREELVRERIDVTHLAERPARTPESVVLVDRRASTRAILHAPASEQRGLAPAEREACIAADWVHVDHAGWAAAEGLPPSRLSVDAGNPVPGLKLDGLGLYSPSGPALGDRYPGLSIMAAVRRALAEGARRVVVTLGAAGALAADRDGAWRVAAVPVEVVSTLGAGDVFHGAMLAGLLGGRPLPEALRLANLAAALSCRALDARSAIPRSVELEAALAGAPPAEAVALDGEP
jgi:sugar/nucleoside kinase (ribokinase family)